jgi:hypothetical protein
MWSGGHRFDPWLLGDRFAGSLSGMLRTATLIVTSHDVSDAGSSHHGAEISRDGNQVKEYVGM